MNKTKIEWCTMTWNPVTGCLHACPYCYAKREVNRFAGKVKKTEERIHSLNAPEYKEIEHYDNGCASIMASITPPEIELRRITWPFGFEPTFHRYRLDEPQHTKKPQNIFVCSMADLFGDWVPDEWLKEVFNACEKAPQHRYIFLTKNPVKYVVLKDVLHNNDRFWYGTTITGQAEICFHSKKWNTFLSIEPLQSEIKKIDFDVKWIIIGAETGNRKGKVIPKREWIETIVKICRKQKIPVFMKNSLAEIWGEPLIQEYPWQENRKAL
jgi:protein gp37